jgi:hypothetical protein
LKSGLGTRYGLGIGVTTESGRRALEHGGEVSGFTAQNVVFPDDGAAISVLTNQDSAEAASAIVRKIAPLLFTKRGSAAASEARARQVFESLQHGKIDRSLFTPDANSYFTDEAVRDFAASLGSLGKPVSFNQTSQRDRGGMTFHGFEVKFSGKTLAIWERDLPDGKIEQFQVMARD